MYSEKRSFTSSDSGQESARDIQAASSAYLKSTYS